MWIDGSNDDVIYLASLTVKKKTRRNIPSVSYCKKKKKKEREGGGGEEGLYQTFRKARLAEFFEGVIYNCVLTV